MKGVVERLGLPDFGPGSRTGGAIYRALIAAAAARVTATRRPGARKLARALGTTAAGRLSAEERDWSARIEARRHELMSNPVSLPGDGPDGDGAAGTEPVPVSTAAEWISLPPVLCTLLMRLIGEHRPASCIELGSGFGISGAYQASALSRDGRLITFERDARLARVAEQGFAALGLGERVELEVGEIEDLLGDALRRAAPVDYVYIDADHTEQASVAQFEAVLPFLSPGAIVVLDDINWGGMTAAWERVSSHERVTVSVAIRRVGVVVVGPGDPPAGLS